MRTKIRAQIAAIEVALGDFLERILRHTATSQGMALRAERSVGDWEVAAPSGAFFALAQIQLTSSMSAGRCRGGCHIRLIR